MGNEDDGEVMVIVAIGIEDVEEGTTMIDVVEVVVSGGVSVVVVGMGSAVVVGSSVVVGV